MRIRISQVHADRLIRMATANVVVALAIVAGIASYRHILEVGWAYGESGWVAYLIPFTIDGLIIASSLALLNNARQGLPGFGLARFAQALGVCLTLGANVLHGVPNGVIGATYAALPAATLTLSFHILTSMIRRAASVAIEEEEEAPGAVELAPEPVEEAAPKRQTVRVAREHIEAAKAFLAQASDPHSVTGRHLAEILPDLVARTRRAVLAKAKEEMGISKPQKPAVAMGEPLPGLTA